MFNTQQIPPAWQRNYRDENINGREKANMRADPEYVDRRRRLEAMLEGKRMRERDPLDKHWIEDWS